MNQSFEGALIGTQTFHPNEGLVLSANQPVYCSSPSRSRYLFSFERPDKPLFAIQYSQSDDAYIVEAGMRRTLFLKSGQPLGVHKACLLARRSELYIEERKNAFVLG